MTKPEKIINEIPTTSKAQAEFDYSRWRKGQFDSMSLEEIGDRAVAYAKQNPFNGKRATMI